MDGGRKTCGGGKPVRERGASESRHRSANRLCGNPEPITALSFSPDSEYFVVLHHLLNVTFSRVFCM